MDNPLDKPTPEQPDANNGNVHVAADPQVNVEVPTTPTEALTLGEINTLLGKSFPTKEKALESLKELNSFVGKRKEDTAEEIRKQLSGEYISKKDLDTMLFYKDNPNLAKHRDVIDAVAKSKGVTAAEATSLPELKTLIDNASGFEKSQEMKSVISSNPRIAAIKDKAVEVKTLMQGGNSEAAGILAAKLVLESLEG